ncbi:bacteriocin secretion accessory protein [Vagococcus fluvialis]|uniref:bacteriocin secretion accessory protein n=1 Tax=Vagococcus fluvialis TaxID=2738 RepID=UPI00379F5EBB
MEKKWKNHSSIYLSKTSKAYKYCLYPVLILLVCLIIFLFVGQIEVIVRGNARVIGEEILIQGINDEPIIENNLVESKKVKKGDSLVKYDTKNYKTENEKLEKQLSEISEEEKALQLLKRSIEEGENLFVKSDTYGYSNKFKEYESNINNYNTQIDLLLKNEEIKNSNKMVVVDEINQLINSKQDYLDGLNHLRQAISGDYTYFETPYPQLISKFNLIRETLKQGTEEEKKLQKNSSIANIDTEITQTQSELDNLKLTKAQNSIQETKQDDPIRLKEEKDKLKETNITQAKTNLSELDKQKMIVEQEKKALENVENTFEIIAPKSGVIHLNSEVDVSSTRIPKGTKLATLFVSNGNKMEIETLIPADEINKLKTGEVYKLELDQKGVSREIYKGNITEISQTSTVTEQGSFYTVKGVLDQSVGEIRYGEIGRLSIIVGKKSYFNYLKDILFVK